MYVETLRQNDTSFRNVFFLQFFFAMRFIRNFDCCMYFVAKEVKAVAVTAMILYIFVTFEVQNYMVLYGAHSRVLQMWTSLSIGAPFEDFARKIASFAAMRANVTSRPDGESRSELRWDQSELRWDQSEFRYYDELR
jgi:hypothetical protein